MKRIGLTLLLLLTLGVNGCWIGLKRHKPQAVPPAPTVAPTPIPETKPETKPEAKPEIKPEVIPETKVETEPIQAPPEPPEQPPVVKPPAKKTPRKPAAPVVPPAAVAPSTAPGTTTATPAPQSVPQLSVLLTAEQRNQYETDYAKNLELAQDGLVKTAAYSLTAAQKESVSRIRSFMHQAEDLKGRDIATAAQLARRAAVLSQDLAESMR